MNSSKNTNIYNASVKLFRQIYKLFCTIRKYYESQSVYTAAKHGRHKCSTLVVMLINRCISADNELIMVRKLHSV